MRIAGRLDRLAAVVVVLAGLLLASAASATCPGPVASRAPLLWRAALQPAEVGVTFLGHASFLIESPGGVSIVTDYNGYNRPRSVPDIVTMKDVR